MRVRDMEGSWRCVEERSVLCAPLRVRGEVAALLRVTFTVELPLTPPPGDA